MLQKDTVHVINDKLLAYHVRILWRFVRDLTWTTKISLRATTNFQRMLHVTILSFSLYHIKILGSHLLCLSYILTHNCWENSVDRRVHDIIIRWIGVNKVLKYNVDFVVNKVIIEGNIICYRDEHLIIKKLCT